VKKMRFFLRLWGKFDFSAGRDEKFYDENSSPDRLKCPDAL
jgi:hypothetical protein